MKRFLFLIFSLILVVSLVAPAFASAGEVEASPDSESGCEVITQVVVPDVVVNNEINIPDDSLGEYVGTSVYALNPVSPSDSNGLKAIMLALIGDWDSIVVEHQYESSQGYTNYVREIQLDYPWLCSCAIFLVVLFCILRGGFAVLCKT